LINGGRQKNIALFAAVWRRAMDGWMATAHAAQQQIDV
jgi:hypothetical protein